MSTRNLEPESFSDKAFWIFVNSRFGGLEVVVAAAAGVAEVFVVVDDEEEVSPSSSVSDVHKVIEYLVVGLTVVLLVLVGKGRITTSALFRFTSPLLLATLDPLDCLEDLLVIPFPFDSLLCLADPWLAFM